MWNRLKKISLTQWIMIAMIIGVLVGHFAPEFSQNVKVISNIFLKMIKSIIVPLLFSTLVVGIAGHTDDLKAVGRLALKSLIYFEIVTTLALVIGLVAVNLTQPGAGVSLKIDHHADSTLVTAQKLTFQGVIEHVVPKSFIESAANNDVLQVVFFSILFSVAITQIPRKHRDTMVHFCESLSEVMFKFTGIVMKFAPFGIGAANRLYSWT